MPKARSQPRSTRLAKLVRPRLFEAQPRYRLFERLESLRQHPVIWISAQPGAGKTTLVASYLETRRTRITWYQVDDGDSDAATFFYYLGLAAKDAGGKGQAALPLFTSEYASDIVAFARRYFRELFARLPAHSVLVFDNFQEVGEGAPLHTFMPVALNEVPPDVNVIVISRTDPPSAYAQLLANRSIGMLTWDQVKLTLDETRAIVRGTAQMDEAAIQRAHELTGGWAAGLTLILEQLRRGAELEFTAEPDELQDVFNYFAQQIFDRADPDNRSILLHAAFLPRISVAALEQLTGNSGAGKLLDYLYRRHLFTDRRIGARTGGSSSANEAGDTYQFHPLFHAFLRHRAREELSASDHATIANRTAHILEAGGFMEDAFELYCQAQNLPNAARVVRDHAAELIGHGRWRVIAEWIDRLSPELVAADQWLTHWRGMAQAAGDPISCRPILERSARLAAQRGDLLCELQSAAGIVNAIFAEYTSFKPVDAWIPTLERVSFEDAQFPSITAELKVQSALLVALLFRQPWNRRLPQCAERVFELIDLCSDANLKVMAVTNLMMFGVNTGQMALARRAVNVAVKLSALAEVLPLNAGNSWAVVGYFHVMFGEHLLGDTALDRARAIAQLHGFKKLKLRVDILAAYGKLFQSQYAALESLLQTIDTSIDPSYLYHRANWNALKGYLAAHVGDFLNGAEFGRAAIEAVDATGSIFHRLSHRNPLILNLIGLGQYAELASLIAETRRLANESGIDWALPVVVATEAMAALRQRARGTCHTLTRELLTHVRSHEQEYMLQSMPPSFSELWAEALHAKIEPDYVTSLIHRFGLKAPTIDCEHWPWRLKIYALGRFQLTLDSQPLLFKPKAPKRLLALLKAILCAGAENVAISKLADQLWPDQDGDTADHACRVALRRLRELLGAPDVLTIADSRVSLDPARVWVDTIVFARLANRQHAANGSFDVPAARRALDLYHGALLPDDQDYAWTVSAREVQRKQFSVLVNELGQELERRGLIDEALQVYGRGVAADDLVESFYRGEMRCLATLGRRDEARTSFTRLSKVLSGKLGLRPSAETLTLAAQVNGS